MQLIEMIDKRRSVRSYTDEPVDGETLQKIRTFIAQAKPLYPELRISGEIIGREHVKCIFPWVTPQVIAIYTEETEGALVNAGFIFQQTDLYLQSLGLGTCWLGMGRLDSRTGVETVHDDGLEFVMMLAFGHHKGKEMRKGAADFKRRSLSEIADAADARLEPARLAPSSVNSQPWYFTHEGDIIHAYCVRQGILKKHALSDMNQIDMGIALAHLYVANSESFRFFRTEQPREIKGYSYIGSMTL